MDDLVEYTNSQDDNLDPLVKSFIAHYQFEAIHPFYDGNGRVGRVLLSMMIYKWHGHAYPWLYLSAFFEKYRDEYVQAMFNISASGRWSSWVELCLRGTIAQAKDAIERCDRFRRLREQFHERVQSQTPRTYQLIDSLFRKPFITIPSAAKKFEISYHTARKDIEKLVEFGILREFERTHPKAFVSDEIMEIAYRETLPPK